MSEGALGIDVYQLTTLIAHAAAGRLDGIPIADSGGRLGMSFFFRRLPKGRNYVVAAGLRSIVEFCQGLRFSEDELRTLDEHPIIGPGLRWGGIDGPGAKVRSALARLDGFVGDIDALPEGTLAFAGPATDEDGQPIHIAGVPLFAYTPLIQVRTGLLCAKLIETPWLSRLNYLSMVASKTARIITAATFDGRQRPVLEFGQRRTHPAAAVDAAYAAYLSGCRGSSNILATHRYGIPSFGTMDHFAVQAAETLDLPVLHTEADFFRRFTEIFPNASTLLVDTYDTFTGIRSAVEATGRRLLGIRIDSNATPATIREARQLLNELGASQVSIFASDSLDEWRVRDLAAAGADGFGVGENITCVPDSATGIGAVGKLVLNGAGKLTMKLSRGSGKATLPGLLQAYRFVDHDLLCLADEPPPPPELGAPLLQPVWRGKSPVAPLPPLSESRLHVARQLGRLPAPLAALELASPASGWPIRLSARLLAVVERLAKAAVGQAP